MSSILQSSRTKFFMSIAWLAALVVFVPALQAQARLGGSQPVRLSPRPSTPLQSGSENPSSKFVQSMVLSDSGPIGAETTTNLFFSQVPIGGGWNVVFTFVNTGATPVNGTLFLRAQDGTPLSANIGGVVSAQVPLNPAIPPGGTRILTANPVNAADPLRTGWARLENIGGDVAGVATFQQTQAGALTTIAGVLSSQPVNAATIPVDNSEAEGRFVGIAVANTGTAPINIRLVTLNEAGTVQDNVVPTRLNLGPGGQTAVFLHEILTTRLTFRGSMALVGQGGQQFVVVALVINRGLITAIPVITGKAPNVPD